MNRQSTQEHQMLLCANARASVRKTNHIYTYSSLSLTLRSGSCISLGISSLLSCLVLLASLARPDAESVSESSSSVSLTFPISFVGFSLLNPQLSYSVEALLSSGIVYPTKSQTYQKALTHANPWPTSGSGGISSIDGWWQIASISYRGFWC